MGVTGEGSRLDDLRASLSFRLQEYLRVLGSRAHQHFRIPLHKLLKDTDHLLPASGGLEVGAAGSVSFLKEVG